MKTLDSNSPEISNFLNSYPEWTFEEDRLKASYNCDSFEEAIAMINEVAACAARLDHHPRMTNTYDRVEFSLCTHRAGDTVTTLDIRLAEQIAAIAAKRTV